MFHVAGIEAISRINEYIESGDPELTLTALKQEDAKLSSVEDKQAHQYQVLLVRKKKQKAEVGLGVENKVVSTNPTDPNFLCRP